MSSLREKLLRHKRPDPAGATAEPLAQAAPVPEGQIEDGGPIKEPILTETAEGNEWAVVGAGLEETEAGSFVMRRRRFEPDFRHGFAGLGELIGRGEWLLPLLGPNAAVQTAPSDRTPFHERLLFLDTETTGLGLGAGNIPFMIGVGYYSGEQYIVEQMLIRHPGEESAMFVYLQDLLERRPILISYNGKSFDWPIIRSRCVMNRVELRKEPEGHIDFLYPSRSLWRNTLPSCRLGMVEEERLGVTREDDVPGSLAPALYFQYLAERDAEVLKGVFLHNELDILSLAGLAVLFAGLSEGRIPWDRVWEAGSEEVFRLGLWLDKLGLRELASAAMEKLFAELTADRLEKIPAEEDDEAAERRDIGYGCLLPLAGYYKQAGRYKEACTLWERYLELKGTLPTASLEPYIELSMFYEHKEKSAAGALVYAERAMDKLRERKTLNRSGFSGGLSRKGKRTGAEERELTQGPALEKRIERLRRKAEAEQARTHKGVWTSPGSFRTGACSGERTAAVPDSGGGMPERPVRGRRRPAAAAERHEQLLLPMEDHSLV
ncbi:ribonuclease H-like domain-containing protein [Paenibacillus filicis]|uniref:Ribonuclease H-like domain-containing protein n=1 Tax=Paenibacillus gyeongsangnamensis TaxID=3388067 RepID=A0ABT4QGD9_9BACL|nr:ribonuclease H-like domain-containing protein [Paenibacillus filicis]MCZ8515857.1 ribonuclease H-like domain-containing protein [Paenibacillus filicis]